MSSSSVQVDGEMSPEFARLDLCARHMTKKWRGTAPPGRAVLRPERQCGKTTLLHAVDANRNAIHQRERLRVLSESTGGNTPQIAKAMNR